MHRNLVSQKFSLNAVWSFLLVKLLKLFRWPGFAMVHMSETNLHWEEGYLNLFEVFFKASCKDNFAVDSSSYIRFHFPWFHLSINMSCFIACRIHSCPGLDIINSCYLTQSRRYLHNVEMMIEGWCPQPSKHYSTKWAIPVLILIGGPGLGRLHTTINIQVSSRFLIDASTNRFIEKSCHTEHDLVLCTDVLVPVQDNGNAK